MPPAPLPLAPDDKTRYFIVCTGRSGSSLLAAVLADAGAQFDMQIPEDWDPADGELEHRLVEECSRLFRRASYIQGGKRYFLLYKYMIDFYRSQGKKRLRAALARARYVKALNADLWMSNVVKLGYRPRIIVNYRDFAANARSYYLMTGMRLPEFATYYRRINGNALLMLNVFGGCAIESDELTDLGETAWADALAQATGLDREALLASRARRVKPRAMDGSDNAPVVPLHDAACEQVCSDLRSLKGIHFPPSGQMRRQLGENSPTPA